MSVIYRMERKRVGEEGHILLSVRERKNGTAYNIITHHYDRT